MLTLRNAAGFVVGGATQAIDSRSPRSLSTATAQRRLLLFNAIETKFPSADSTSEFPPHRANSKQTSEYRHHAICIGSPTSFSH
jgi:hypothetical protein